MGLVTLACISCVTSTIVAEPIKSQHFNNYENDYVYSWNFVMTKMANLVASSVVNKIGDEVPRFMGYS